MPSPTDPATAVEAHPDPRYRIGCPDVLEVSVKDRPGSEAIVSVDLDGRLPLEDGDGPRVEGLTLPEAQAEIAKVMGVPAEKVDVRLAVPRSARVYLHGPIRGRLRIVPYQGPELVMDFLGRVGGLPPGSKLNKVFVVRPNVSAGSQSQVYHIDVEAVLLDGDTRTNIPLRPSDQLYIGETRRSSFSRILPDWLRPAYRRVAGLLPDDWRPWTWVKRDRENEP